MARKSKNSKRKEIEDDYRKLVGQAIVAGLVKPRVIPGFGELFLASDKGNYDQDTGNYTQGCGSHEQNSGSYTQNC